MEIKELKEKYIEDAAKVFISNYGVLKKENPELPSVYSDLDFMARKIKKIINENPSAVALIEGKVVGYMTGISDINGLKGSAKGVYVPEISHSCWEVKEKEEIYYRMYQKLAMEWVDNKNHTHIITYFATDNLLHNLFQHLSFGLLVIDGLKPVHSIHSEKIHDIIIRQANSADLEKLGPLDRGIDRHLMGSPVFLHMEDEDYPMDTLKRKFLSDDIGTFIALKDEEIIACIRGKLNYGPGCTIVRDTGTLGINFAYTNPSIRGKGVGANILRHLLNWGYEHKMVRCAVDFESQNREASRFWLSHFKPICFSAMRKIDDRL